MNDPHLVPLPTLEPGRARRLRFGVAGMSLRARQFRARVRTRLRSERGAATAEYAITTLAAVGFAGLLVVILRSGEVRGMLTDLVRNALSIPA
ncbi:DUF4244 domain-containing protein [Salinibacterium sp. NK8237]|uniref:DUF4244 domain-containing protein n=1 Tax=Salinibacterium sp. NK8237 TaxID=2792038 RepID=UPI0018CEE77D|nr:DUF4244 domain-containing protein [Salinibacterium sp. NK8237]MBH0130999.1 DUF4244 domain-containing protein [Salinibacterium sp. NK8237]